jgi:membrane protease YdiL (CAAX protease family)
MNCSSTGGFANLKIVLEAFVVLHGVQFVTGFYLLPFLLERDLGLPSVTVARLTTSSTSLLLAVAFVFFRSRTALVWATRQTLTTIFAGMFLLWMIRFVALVWFDKSNPEARAILDLQGSPLYITIFSLVVWGPFLEEILFRGFFFELTKHQLGVMASVTLTSVLFVVSHGIWEGFGPQSVLYFVDSLVFTAIYTQGGILAAGLAHGFANGYVFLLNA